jgi:[acyl-carrier-protein] S-malonyltransferase
LKVIAVRGEEMQKAVENSNTTMAAVLTNDLEITIEEINKLNNQGIQIWISNFNDPSQVVISSYTDDMDFLKSNPKALGAKRVIPLEVAGAFHTEIVSPAKKPLKDALSEINISEGKIPVYMNVDGKKVEVSSLKDNLVNQIDNSVLFNLQINNVNKDVNPDLWCHIGPGNVTAGMLRKSISYKDLKIINSLESSK